MIAEISAALSSINGAVQLTRGVIGLQQDVAVKLELSKMLDAVLEAKTGLLAASETIENLQDEVRRLKSELAVTEDLTRYEVVELQTGAQVVRVKPSELRSEDETKLTYCPNCFGRKDVRLLQSEHDDSYYRCFDCKQVFKRDFRQDSAMALRSKNARSDY